MRHADPGRGILLLAACALATVPAEPPAVLPAPVRSLLVDAIEQSRPHQAHVWRDTTPFNSDGTVNAYIEIARGDRTKWEFDIGLGRRTVDRVLPEELGGYPVNYGFVPQTISYDGDPFDALVLGPPIEGGQLVRGEAVNLMVMEDDKGHDPKVVLSRRGADGRLLHELTGGVREPIGRFFDRYKRHEPGKHSKVSGWGAAAEGLAYVRTTHLFFLRCRQASASPCDVSR